MTARLEVPGFSVRTVVTAALATSLGVLPPFLLGAMSFQIRAEMGFSQGALGVAIAAFFLSSSLSSVPAGRLAERTGGRKGMRIATTATFVSLVGVAAVADSLLEVIVFLAVGGVGMSLSAAASNLSVARIIPPSRLGLAFGFSKAAGPAATMLAGFAVPAVALTVGWRWAFAVFGMLALTIYVIAPDDVSISRKAGVVPARDPYAPGPLIVLAAATGFGIGAGNSMGAFFVESAVAHGFEPGFAGTALAVGSVAGLVARVLWGWIADRRSSGRLHMVAGLMLGGAAAMAPLGFVEHPAVLLVVAMLVFSAAWGWTGVLIFSVVRLRPAAPAAATGITGAGMFIGATIGPVVFGTVAQSSYVAMWLIGAGWLVAAAALTEVGRTAALRQLRSSPAPSR